jgi:predicted glycoside hydrolase/deacetylase ChbG (UPF0249 family)
MEEGHAKPDENNRDPLYGMKALQQTQSTRRKICICVDDYGLHDGINMAALDLFRLGRISAVSCLVDGPAWLSGVKALRGVDAQPEMGLHLNFTEHLGQKFGPQSLPRLVFLAYSHQLDRSALKRDIQRQLERFESAMSRAPDFIDGHQHVHQFPVIREVLFEVLNARFASDKPWLRSTCAPRNASVLEPFPARFKSWMIEYLGAAAFGRLAKHHGYPQNSHLLGVYGFDLSEKTYLRHLGKWFNHAVSGDVLMCHPSLNGAWDDQILAARNREYRVLTGYSFHTLIQDEGIEIGTLQEPG